MNNPEQALASYERYREALSKAGQSHKTLIFDALAAADITNVHIEFDGVGDSGQIYCVTAYHGEQKVDRDLYHEAGLHQVQLLWHRYPGQPATLIR